MSTTHMLTPPSHHTPIPTNNAASETGPPTHPLRRKAYTQHLQNERAAIKTHLDRFIATTTTTSSTSSSTISSAEYRPSEADERWKLLVEQRAGKVRERVERGKGSTEKEFPEFWDAEREVAWLRRGWRGFLEGGGGDKAGKGVFGGGADGDGCGKGGLRTGRGEDRDDDEEEMFMGVKKEEGGGEGGDEVGGEVVGAGPGCGGGKGQQTAGTEGSSPEVKGEMGGEGVEGALMSGQMDEMDDQGQVQRKKLGRSKGKAHLVHQGVVGVPCSRGWAIQNSSAESVDTAEIRIADVVLGFAGPRGAVFESVAAGEAETDDFELGSKRKAEDEMKLPAKKIKRY
ncbi:hypothetical protein KC326_g6572 [Hortaea werneckii]|nr:hypothetical protein KC326_g6572 [Hortaea werneckii]